MERIDTTTPHGWHTTTIPKDQFLMLMYDIAEIMLHMDVNSQQEPEWYVDEAEEILIRNGILKGE